MCVRRMAQFLVSLLPTSPSQTEKSVIIGSDTSPDVSRASPVASSGVGINGSDLFDVSASPVVFRIRLRNVLLHVILRLATSAPSTSNSQHSGTIISAQSVTIVYIVTTCLLFGVTTLYTLTSNSYLINLQFIKNCLLHFFLNFLYAF